MPPAGETGSALKLAHTLYSVALRYYGRHLLNPEQIRRRRRNASGHRRRASSPDLNQHSPALAFRRRKKSPAPLPTSANYSPPPQKAFPKASLTPHRAQSRPPATRRTRGSLFSRLIHEQRDQRPNADGISTSIDHASFHGLFDSISSALAQQFVLLPYYFAMFHQNKERRLLRHLTGEARTPSADSLKVGLFTDTLDETNGVCRFIRDVSAQAKWHGRHLTILTCSPKPSAHGENRINFSPLASYNLPLYPQSAASPAAARHPQACREEHFDVIHVAPPAPWASAATSPPEAARPLLRLITPTSRPTPNNSAATPASPRHEAIYAMVLRPNEPRPRPQPRLSRILAEMGINPDLLG